MPANPICRVLLPNGQPCGYQPDGKDAKEKLTHLFRHERDVHLEVAVVNKTLAAKLLKDEQ